MVKRAEINIGTPPPESLEEPAVLRQTSASTEPIPQQLEPLPTTDPATSIAYVRGALREGRILSFISKTSPRAWEWQSCAENSAEEYKFPQERVVRAAGRLASAVDRYANKYGATPSPDDAFIHAVGKLYFADVAALAEVGLTKPFDASLTNGVSDYWRIRQRFTAEAGATNVHIRQAFQRPDPEKLLAQYANALEYCKTKLLPDLCQEYGFEIAILDTIPFSRLQEACFYHPKTFPSVVKQWFEAVQENAAVATRLGVDIGEPSLSAVTATSTKALLLGVTVARSECLYMPTEVEGRVIADFANIQEAYRNKRINIGMCKVVAKKTLVERLRRTFGEDTLYADMDFERTAAFISPVHQVYNEEFPDEQLPNDQSFILQLCRVYLDTVRSFEERGFRQYGKTGPYNTACYSIARSQDVATYDRLMAEYAKMQIPSWTVRNAFIFAPRNPSGYMANFMSKRDALSGRIFERTGQVISPKVLNTLAQPLPVDPEAVADNFIDTYLSLLSEFQDDELVQPWMVADAVAFWPRRPRARIYIMKSMARRGATESSLFSAISNTDLVLGDKLENETAVDPQTLYDEYESRREEISEANRILATLDDYQRLAVAHVFGFPLPDTSESLGNIEEMLCGHFGTDDLGTYVRALLTSSSE